MDSGRANSRTTAEPDRRRTAPFEWWYLAFPRNLSPVMNLCVEGSGRVDPEALREAVAVASQACPGARLVRRGRYLVDSGLAPSVRWVRSGPLDADRLHEIPELRAPLPRSRGVLSEVVVFDGPAPTLAFRASHAVFDGHGLLLWAGEVFRALRGEEPLGADWRTTIVELDDPLYRDADVSRLHYDLPSLLGVPERAGASDVLWRRRTVDGNFPGVAAVVGSYIAERSDLPVAPISFPVNLRPFHPGVRSTANLAVTVVLDLPRGQPWATTYQQMLNVLLQRRGQVHAPGPEVLKAPLTVLKALISLSDRRFRTRDRLAGLANVNNMGRVDPAVFTTPGFEASGVYLLPPREPASPLGITLVEGDGHTEITLAWVNGAGMARSADAFLDDLGEELSPIARRRASTLTPAATHATAARDLVPAPDAAPGGRSVVESFLDQARRTPDAIAVSGSQGDLTYAQLDNCARAIAGRLRARGVGRNMVVGLLTDRSLAAVAGAWGVLMAGAAYLPMDTKHPDDRIRALLEDAGAGVCLTERPQDGRDCMPGQCAGLVLDDLIAQARAGTLEPAPAPDPPDPADLAYVVYTSGSTGRPKGVEIEHRSLSNYARWSIRDHGIDATTRLPLLCSLSFDVAEISLILPVLVGGTVLTTPDEISHVSIREMLDGGANMLALTPSHLDLISRLDMHPRGVHTLIVIGEQLTRSVALRAHEQFGPQCRIINLYGPAEATIGVSHHFFDPARDTGAAVPIGVPLDTTVFYLLDPQRRFAEAGETAELYIGGVQLARGYRGRPDLTRDRFTRMADGTRVYRTGDIVRRLPSGGLEFCGRIDDQLKIQGHRIEPAEIVAALQTHPAVTQAVVVARSRDGRPEQVLCGYVTLAEPVTTDGLLAHLSQRLPSYMVPTVLVALEELPYSVNGKVAVGALPDPFTGSSDRAETVVSGRPLDEVEDQVARIWATVLDGDRAGIAGDTDFHRLGGTSMSLIAMVAEVSRHVVGAAGERAFTSRMSEILAQPTVARVAALARACQDQPAQDSTR